MSNRISNVENIKITRAGIATVVEVGDSERMIPVSNIIAVQREQALFIENEFNFRDYSLFVRPLIQPVINENIRMNTINESPAIRVHKIDIFSVASSSVVHIGSSEMIRSESRIKNIRHLLRERPQTL